MILKTVRLPASPTVPPVSYYETVRLWDSPTVPLVSYYETVRLPDSPTVPPISYYETVPAAENGSGRRRSRLPWGGGKMCRYNSSSELVSGG